MRAAQEPFEPKPRLPIIDELIMTVLSQATSDVNSERAFAHLKEAFSSWQQVADAPVEEVADAIRSGGIANVKAARIKEILGAIEASEGKLDLERLDGLGDREVSDYLCSLPGVGPKTAACVLLFSMERPAFPVDTHVERIAKRLGLVEPKTNATQVQKLLEPVIPPELRYEFHIQLIRHGRRICRARMPRCSDCVLFDLCEAGPSLLAAGEAV